MYMGDAQENWVSPPDASSYHLRYHLQLKTKDAGNGEPGVEGYQEKHSKQG